MDRMHTENTGARMHIYTQQFPRVAYTKFQLLNHPKLEYKTMYERERITCHMKERKKENDMRMQERSNLLLKK